MIRGLTISLSLALLCTVGQAQVSPRQARAWQEDRIWATVEVPGHAPLEGVLLKVPFHGVYLLQSDAPPIGALDTSQIVFIRLEDIALIRLRRKVAWTRRVIPATAAGAAGGVLSSSWGYWEGYEVLPRVVVGSLAGLGAGLASAFHRRMDHTFFVAGNLQLWSDIWPTLVRYSLEEQSPRRWRRQWEGSVPPLARTQPMPAATVPVDLSPPKRLHLMVSGGLLFSQAGRQFARSYLPIFRYPDEYSWELGAESLAFSQVEAAWPLALRWRARLAWQRFESPQSQGFSFTQNPSLRPAQGFFLHSSGRLQLHTFQAGAVWLPGRRQATRPVHPWEPSLSAGLSLNMSRPQVGIGGHYIAPDSSFHDIGLPPSREWRWTPAAYLQLSLDYYLTEWLSWQGSVAFAAGPQLALPSFEVRSPQPYGEAYPIGTNWRRYRVHGLSLSMGLHLHLQP